MKFSEENVQENWNILGKKSNFQKKNVKIDGKIPLNAAENIPQIKFFKIK